MSGSPSAERAARQALLHAGEPGDARLARFVAVHGPLEAVGRLWAGDEADRDGRYGQRLHAADPVAELARAGQVGARLVVPDDAEWPADQLAGLAVPPHALWVRGLRPLAATVTCAVSVVGSRASTAYGEHVATELASGLADHAWTVVSGAAYGIDGAAHRACLAVGGVTVAVLAGGVDDAYPRGHDSLLRRVVQEGLVVSELPLGRRPSRSRFLERNRLIAAFGAGTVAVEMALRSGARNTVEHAHRLFRPVMAVPGPVSSALSAGCHELIARRQAELVCDASDVLRLVAPIGTFDEPVRRGATRSTDGLGVDALAVFEALPPAGLVPMPRLPERARLPAAIVGDALRELVVAGLVDVFDGTVGRSRPTRRGGP